MPETKQAPLAEQESKVKKDTSKDNFFNAKCVAYINLWSILYRFRIGLLAKLFGIAIIVLSVIEILGSFTHLMPERQARHDPVTIVTVSDNVLTVSEVFPFSLDEDFTVFGKSRTESRGTVRVRSIDANTKRIVLQNNPPPGTGPGDRLAIAESPPRFWENPWFHRGVAVLLILTAVTMVWHHRVLHSRVDRYRALTNSIVILEDAIRSSSAKNNVNAILDGLVKIIEFKGAKKPSEDNTDDEKWKLANATIVQRKVKDNDPFSLYAQDRRNVFKKEMTIPAKGSVAGELLTWEAAKAGVLLYVPKTRLLHGVAIWTEGGEGSSISIFDQTKVSEPIYKDLDVSKDPTALLCLLCLQIPLNLEEKPSDSPAIEAILCVGGHKEDCLDDVAFTAAKISVQMLRQVIRKYSDIAGT